MTGTRKGTCPSRYGVVGKGVAVDDTPIDRSLGRWALNLFLKMDEVESGFVSLFRLAFSRKGRI